MNWIELLQANNCRKIRNTIYLSIYAREKPHPDWAILPDMGSPELAQFGYQRYRPTQVEGVGLCRWEPLVSHALCLEVLVKKDFLKIRVQTHDLKHSYISN